MTKSEFNKIKIAYGDIVTLNDGTTHTLTGVDWSRNEVEMARDWVKDNLGEI